MDVQATKHAPATFKTDSFSLAQRFDAYRDYTRSINDISVSQETRTNFAASTINWVLGRIMVGVVRTPQMRLSRSVAQIRQDDLDHWVLRVSCSGEVASRVGERSYRSGPGDLVLETLAAPYDDEWTPGEWVSVAFPRDMTPILSRRNLQACIGPRRDASARVLSRFLISLVEGLPSASPEDMPRLVAATHAMILAMVEEAQCPSQVPTPARVHIDQVILDNIASARLTPERIAVSTGISRAKLYRLFEAEGGVAAYVRRLRLAKVRADLSDPAMRQEPIARIAERWGFHCTAAFNRSFRTAYGMTPGDMREQRAVAPCVCPSPRASSSKSDLASLLALR